eukprot:5629374-Prymnesium_polylepis.1
MLYVRSPRIPLDRDTKQRITANPLVMFMMMGIFDKQRGVAGDDLGALRAGFAGDAGACRASFPPRACGKEAHHNSRAPRACGERAWAKGAGDTTIVAAAGCSGQVPDAQPSSA